MPIVLPCSHVTTKQYIDSAIRWHHMTSLDLRVLQTTWISFFFLDDSFKCIDDLIINSNSKCKSNNITAFIFSKDPNGNI